MTISTLITELQKLQDLHGDLPVTSECSAGNEFSDEVVIQFAELSDEPYLSEPVGDDMSGPHIHLYS